MLATELVAVGLTLVAVYLRTGQNIWCWPLGMVSGVDQGESGRGSLVCGVRGIGSSV